MMRSRREAHVVEEAVVGLGGVPAERAQAADGDAGEGRVDQEHADAIVAAAGLGLCHHDQVVRHVRRAVVDLLTLEDVAVALAHGRELDAGDVRAVVGLAQTQGKAHVAGDDLGQHLALHVVRAVQRHVHAGVDHRDAVSLGDAAVVVAERLAENGQVHIAAAHAAVLGRIHQAHVAGIGQRLVRLEWVFTRLVELADLGQRQHAIEQAQHAGAHLALLLAEAECQMRFAHAIRSLMSGRTSAAKRSNCSPRRS